MAEAIVELQDIINVRELPREPRPGDLWVLAYDGFREGKMYFAFKNIGTPLEEIPEL